MTDDKTKQDTPVYETAWYPCSLSFLRCSHPTHVYTMTNSTEQSFSSLPPFFFLFIVYILSSLLFGLYSFGRGDYGSLPQQDTANSSLSTIFEAQLLS